MIPIFFSKVMRRLVRHRRILVLFAVGGSTPAGRAGFEFLHLTQESPADEPIVERAMVLAGEPEGLTRARLNRGDECFGWTHEGKLVSLGWVTYSDRSVGPVKLLDKPGRAFLYNFHTLEPFRGQNLYPDLIARMRSVLCSHGIADFVIDVSVDNRSSVRGIEKAGFSQIGEVSYVYLMGRWSVWPRAKSVASDSQSVFPS
jgi:hypothetical protein